MNYTGAPYLAAGAAARVGAGLVTLAAPQPIAQTVASRLTEATYLLVPHTMGATTAAAVKVLSERLAGYRALLVGPGLGTERETVAFVRRLLGFEAAQDGRRMGFQGIAATPPEPLALPPLVLDADALNALYELERWWVGLPAVSVLTPHPGEMARLTGLDIGEINGDRIAVARRYAQAWAHVVVLKGAHTVVASPDGRATVVPVATAALATAGTGDVLAGAIAGFMAQGLAPYHGAVCGAYVHGLAGQLVAERIGLAGALAGDLLPALPEALRMVRE